MTLAFVQLGQMCCDVRFNSAENASYYLFKSQPLALKIWYDSDEVVFLCITELAFFEAFYHASSNFSTSAWYPVHMDLAFLISYRETAVHNCVETCFYSKGEQLIFKAISTDPRPYKFSIQTLRLDDTYSLPCTAHQTVALYVCQ